MNDTWTRYQDDQMRMLRKINNCALELKFAARQLEREYAWAVELDIHAGLAGATRRLRQAEEALDKAQCEYWDSSYAKFCDAEEAQAVSA